MDGSNRGRIVVGVDGTSRSIAALRWAASEATIRGAEVYVVHAWGSALRPASYAPAAAAQPSREESAQLAEKTLAESVHLAFGDQPPMSLRGVVDARPPVPALLDHGQGAVLLVLAARGDASPADVGLGSTALACLRNAPCPIVVLPTSDAEAR